MKKVFSNNELPHIWAKQTQDEARGASMFFNGTKIYSYGRHFCMANIIAPGIVLFTTRTYSSSTAKHLSYTRYAVNHMERVYCAYPENDNEAHIKNLEAWTARIRSNIADIENTRTRPQTKEAAKGALSSIVQTVSRYCEVTGFDFKKKQRATSDEETRKEFLLYFEVANNLQALPDLQKKLARKEKAEEKAKQKRRAAALAEHLEKLKEWRRGANVYLSPFEDAPVYLRAKSDPGASHPALNPQYIQTSKGASVSYRAGKLLWDMIQAGKDIKGHQIDGYTVISVNGSLKIGCHEIDMKEVRRFAKQQKWI